MSDHNPDIWQLQAQFDIKGLMKALQSDDAGIRRRAAAALRTMDATDAIPALKYAYRRETNPDAKTMIVAALKSLIRKKQSKPPVRTATDELSYVSQLIRRLESNDPDTLIHTANELGELGDKLAVEPLVLLFNDVRMSIQVRLAIAEALIQLESAPVEVALLANLRHADWRIRRNGAAILGQLKSDWAVQPLSRALNDDNEHVRRTARAALKHIGTPEARKALAKEGTRRARPMQPRTPTGEKKKVDPKPKSPANGLLRFIEKQEKRHDRLNRSKRSTAPLDEDAVKGDASDKPSSEATKRNRHYEPTQPIDTGILRELEAEEPNDD